MELVRKLGTRISKSGHKDSWGVFYCEHCQQQVEKLLHIGYKAQSCGCIKLQLISSKTKGKLKSEEHKLKIGLGNEGKKQTEEAKQKIRDFQLGRKQTIEQRQNISKSLKGKSKSEEHRQNISKALKGKYAGKLAHQWQNGISFEPYGIDFNKKLKQSIKERDNYTCQMPGCMNTENLHVHHIDYDKNNNNPKNLITLCNSCHAKTIGKSKRKYFIEFYQNIMEKTCVLVS